MTEDRPSRLKLFMAEMTGTGLLLLIGLSSVIFMFAASSPFVTLVPSLTLRRVLNGFFFGSVGATIALSPLGKISGGHINPIVTMGFWLFGKLQGRTAIGYVIAQFTGAVLGSLPLLLWGTMGRSLSYAVTVPGKGYSIPVVVVGEVATTFCLITYLCVFLASHRLRKFTAFFMPLLFAIMVPLEAGISGISVNPARSFGPSVISGVWNGWWIYWIGPLLGGLLAILVCNRLARRIEVAKLYHFDSDPEGLLRRVQRPSQVAGISS
jgi:aquaporin Z